VCNGIFVASQLDFGKTVIPAKAIGTTNRMESQQGKQAIKRLMLRLGEENRCAQRALLTRPQEPRKLAEPAHSRRGLRLLRFQHLTFCQGIERESTNDAPAWFVFSRVKHNFTLCRRPPEVWSKSLTFLKSAVGKLWREACGDAMLSSVIRRALLRCADLRLHQVSFSKFLSRYESNVCHASVPVVGNLGPCKARQLPPGSIARTF
jgi:hypothetical protein